MRRPYSQATTIIRKCKTFGVAHTLPQSGRSPKLSPASERKLVRMVPNNPKRTKKHICRDCKTPELRCRCQQSSVFCIVTVSGAAVRERNLYYTKGIFELVYGLQVITTKDISFEMMFYGQMNSKSSFWPYSAEIRLERIGAFNPKNTKPSVKHGGGSIML